MGPTRRLLSKPVIAAVEGHAVAGGLELALWCDLRVASETAIFGVFCRRWGVPLIDGGTVRLPRIVGQGRALDMILTGRAVEAAEALSWGLADRVVAAGEALATAHELAAQIAAFPQLCLRADRASAFAQWDVSLEEALKVEADRRAGAVAPRGPGRRGAVQGRRGAWRSARLTSVQPLAHDDGSEEEADAAGVGDHVEPRGVASRPMIGRPCRISMPIPNPSSTRPILQNRLWAGPPLARKVSRRRR
jgi:hypothetical protein